MRTRLCIAAALWIVSSGAPAAPVAEPENLAPKAKVWASSEYNSDYAARFAVDGKVPEAECKSDARDGRGGRAVGQQVL